MDKEKKQTEDEIMLELRNIRAEIVKKFPTKEEYSAYLEKQEEELKKEGWVFSSPGKKKKIAEANK